MHSFVSVWCTKKQIINHHTSLLHFFKIKHKNSSQIELVTQNIRFIHPTGFPLSTVDRDPMQVLINGKNVAKSDVWICMVFFSRKNSLNIFKFQLNIDTSQPKRLIEAKIKLQ